MASTYALTELARAPEGTDLRPYVISINSRGEVAYQVALSDGETAVRCHDGAAVTEVARAGRGRELARITSHPALEPDGAVWFYAVLADDREALVRAGSDGLVIATHTAAGELTAVGPLGPTVNADGVVGFRATTCAGHEAIFAPEWVADTAGELAAFDGLPVVTPNGAVVFRAQRRDGSQLIARAGATGLTVVADTRAGFRELGRFPAAIDDDTVAFVGVLASGIAGAFAVTDGALTTIADSSGGFDSFRGVLLDGAGRAVFFATPPGGELGIYAGPDPARDRILAIGADGVTGFALNPVSINRHGQLAIRLEYEGGEQTIARLDPV